MKTKLLALMLIFVLSITFVACDNKEELAEETGKTQSLTDDVEKETKHEETTKVLKEDNKEDNTVETLQEELINKDLEGIDLVNSIDNQRPNRLMIKSEMTTFGTTTKITTYYDGNNSKTEMDIDEVGKSILIHLGDEEVMYQYVYGDESGVKMTGASTTYAEEMGLMLDTSMLAEITDASSKDMIARVENLDGEEVVYIEATESDEEMGDVLVKMWYSEKYATPLKYEIIMGEQPLAELIVTKITDSVNFDESTFLPPTDVEFEEVSMESLMADW